MIPCDLETFVFVNEESNMIAPVEHDRAGSEPPLRPGRTTMSEVAEPEPRLQRMLSATRGLIAQHPTVAIATAVAFGVGAGWFMKRRGN